MKHATPKPLAEMALQKLSFVMTMAVQSAELTGHPIQTIENEDVPPLRDERSESWRTQHDLNRATETQE